MSTRYEMAAQPRDRAGKGVARALRRENKVPAVIYGDNKEPVLITLSGRDVSVEYNKGRMFTLLCEMKIEGGDKMLVLARDIQTHPVTDFVQHIDFLRVTKKTKIAVDIPVTFINEDQAPGLTEESGILNVVRYDIELNCSATNIPDTIEADLSGLNIGDSIKLSDVTLPEGTSPVIEDRDFTIATLVAPKTVEEEEAEAAENEESLEVDDEEGVEGEEGAEGEEAEGGEDAKEE